MPPAGALQFVSDAAVGLGKDEWAGVASLGLTSNGNGIWYLGRGSWPASVYTGKDEHRAHLASEMTTLETIGLLIPFLTVLNRLAGCHVVLGVDNLRVVFGWVNCGVKGHTWASVLIRALHVVASYLACTVYVQHVPRQSSAASVMADSLTRSSTATAAVWVQATGAEVHVEPHALWEWLSAPSKDWMLGFRLVNELKKRL
jgi:hypothetical protein